LFAGEPPLYFKDTLATTSKEEHHWIKFWEDNGARRESVFYCKGLGDEPAYVMGQLLSSRYEIAGLIIDKVDRIMHGMESGTIGMHQQVKLWTEQGYLSVLIGHLFECGFSVYLTKVTRSYSLEIVLFSFLKVKKSSCTEDYR